MHWHSPGPIRRPPGFVEPCLPTSSHTVPTGPQWAFEIKFDGFRFICRRDGARVRVFSRRGHDWTDRVPRIAEALLALPVESIVIDGEGVVCGSDGIADFDALRASVGRKGARQAFLYAFDLLSLDGEDLRSKRWDARRDTLASLLRKTSGGMPLSEHIDDADGARVYEHACRMGLEGIVAKKRDRPYGSGRTTDWLKIRNPAAPAVTRLLEE